MITKFFMAGHALIELNRKYLITRRTKQNSYKPLKWDIPGGIVNAGETVEEAIFREVKEETTLEIEISKVIFLYSNRDQVPIRETFQSVYSSNYKSGKVSLDPMEHDMYEWVSYAEIANHDLIDFLRELVKNYKPTRF